MPETRIGISGWTYAPWRGTFYPKGVSHKQELSFASRRLNSIEINGTFYSLQRPSSYQTWYDATPDDFIFSLKGSRFVTHMKKLKDVETPLANFFAQGLLALREKLGPILWQFPPNFIWDESRFATFFDLLPRDTNEAAKLAKRHDKRLAGRSLTKADQNRPLRYAVEIRHDSFRDPAFVSLLRKQDVALVVADTAGKWPFLEDVTSDFVYARLHGDKQLYVSGYDDASLDAWAAKCDAWRSGREAPDAKRASEKPARKRKSRDVFVYFDNDVKVRAPFDAARLAQRLGVATDEAAAMLRSPPDLTGATAMPREAWPGIPRRAPAAKPRRTRGN